MHALASQNTSVPSYTRLLPHHLTSNVSDRGSQDFNVLQVAPMQEQWDQRRSCPQASRKTELRRILRVASTRGLCLTSDHHRAGAVSSRSEGMWTRLTWNEPKGWVSSRLGVGARLKHGGSTRRVPWMGKGPVIDSSHWSTGELSGCRQRLAARVGERSG